MHSLALVGFSLIAGCGSLSPKTSSDESDDDGSGPGGGGDSVSIVEIQMGEVSEGSTVTLKDVVATSPITAEGKGFFVQDAGGGAYSGIYVYVWEEVGANPTVGDVLTLTGTIKEFYNFTEIEVTDASGLSTNGSADVVPTVLDEEPENWEAYESVLVTLNDQTVTNASNLTSYGEVSLSLGVQMDNLFFNFDAESGDVFESVTGPIHYSFEQYKLCPRTPADLGDSAAGVPTQATVTAIQSGEIGEGAQVELEGLVVTSGLTYDDKGFYVQDAGGGAWSGIYVYIDLENGGASLEGLVPGAIVNISGATTEYYEFTELKVSSLNDIVITDSTAEPVVTPIVGAPEDWEMYEGCLVSIANVSASSDADEYGAVDLDNGLLLDDSLMDLEVDEGDAFSTITGQISYEWEHYRLNPRGIDDLVSD
jgi:predicted extracellular nuclease